MKLYASGEDYLEAILMLQKKNGMVRSIDLAWYVLLTLPGTWRFLNPALVMRSKPCVRADFSQWTRIIACI